jgi:hypothetical protein
MALATGAVLLLTTFATALGASPTGLLAPFPLYAAVLWGLLLGLFAFASFFLVLTELLAVAATAAATATAF